MYEDFCISLGDLSLSCSLLVPEPIPGTLGMKQNTVHRIAGHDILFWVDVIRTLFAFVKSYHAFIVTSY